MVKVFNQDLLARFEEGDTLPSRLASIKQTLRARSIRLNINRNSLLNMNIIISVRD